MKIHRIAIGALAFAVTAKADQNDDYSEGVIPPRLAKWPDSLKDYQELPGSRSPDGQYGFIYPRRNVVEEIDDSKLYLARLKPLQLIANLPIKYGNLCGNTGSSYFADWSPDSRGAIFYVGGKKGPFNIFVISLGKQGSWVLTDLETRIRTLVQASYQQSGGPRFNDYFDFIFTDGDDFRGSDGGSRNVDSSWTWNDRHHVLVTCICTNDPKRMSRPLWEIVFTGTWDIAGQKFTNYHVERIDQKSLPPF